MVAPAKETVQMRAITVPALFVILLALASCGGRSPERPVEASGPGKVLYERNCSMCHGPNGVAARIGRGAVDLNDAEWQRRTSDEQIAERIREGRGQMPAWKNRLSEDEIRAVVDYVRTFE